MSFLKQCTKCGKVKFWYEFNKDKSKTHGLKSQCKACQRQYDKKWREENKELISFSRRKLGINGVTLAKRILDIVDSGKAYEAIMELEG
jgi:hypothetical protein